MESFKKNDSTNLAEKRPGMKNVMVGCGWDIEQFEGRDTVDVDLSCFLLDIGDRTRIDEDFVFYNNLETQNGAIRHKGDNRTGAGEGDDEIIFLDLSKIDLDVATIVFVASIYEAEKNEKDFSHVKNAYIRVLDEDSRDELIRFTLSEDFAGETAVKIAALERAGSDWYFKALGEPVKGGLAALGKKYGLIIAEV